jgi:hypothetical protein
MAQDPTVQFQEAKTRMITALQLAKEYLSAVHLLTPGIGARPTDQPDPNALPIAILAAELYKDVQP